MNAGLTFQKEKSAESRIEIALHKYHNSIVHVRVW